MFIDPTPPETASGPVAELYERETARSGYLPEYVQAFSPNPEAYEAWLGVFRSARDQMDPRRFELVTLVAAQALRSTNCSIAHGKRLRDRFYPYEQVVQIAKDRHHAGLDETDVAVMDFAAAVAASPSEIEQADVDRLKSLGLSDRDVFDIVLSVGVRAMFATVVEALGAPPEQPMIEGLEPELLQSLVAGRPVDGMADGS